MKRSDFKFLFVIPILAMGCATYSVSTQSLLVQFANTRTEKKVLLVIASPFFFYPGIVNGNDLREIKCLDKKGQEKVIPVTNRTGIRITRSDQSRSTFYKT